MDQKCLLREHWQSQSSGSSEFAPVSSAHRMDQFGAHERLWGNLARYTFLPRVQFFQRKRTAWMSRMRSDRKWNETSNLRIRFRPYQSIFFSNALFQTRLKSINQASIWLKKRGTHVKKRKLLNINQSSSASIKQRFVQWEATNMLQTWIVHKSTRAVTS